MFNTLPIDQLVDKARTMYTNASANDEIKALLADPYGYTDTDYAEGLQLVRAVVDTETERDEEDDQKRTSTVTVQERVAAVREAWVDHRELVRLKVKRSDQAYRTLGLDAQVPDARAEVLAGARRFYTQLRDRPELAGGARGITAEIATARLANIEAAEVAIDAQTDEKGDVRLANAERKAAVAALRAHATEMRAIAQKALSGRPDLLGDLGL
jgi:hypothetical protein